MIDSNCSMNQASAGGFDARLFQSSADCIKILDMHGRVTEINPGGVQALELDDEKLLHGREWSEFWPEEVKESVAVAVSHGLAGERSQFAAYCPTFKGTSRWWDVVVTPIRDDKNEVRQLMVISRDMTDLHLARIALLDAMRRKDEFLALVAHELRNPLAAAGMASTVLQTQELPSSRITEIGHLIQRQVAHMSRLAEDLLDISRLTRGDLSIKLEPVELKEVIGAVLEQLQPTYTAKGQQVQTTLCEDKTIVLGDKMRLIQVVGNIVGNAVRYTPQGGWIDIILSYSDARVSLSVADSGIGIDVEAIPTLFDLFKQGKDIAHKERKSDGLGIGLAIVRNLIERHGGNVSASSQGAGQGSSFVIDLPAHETTDSLSCAAKASTASTL